MRRVTTQQFEANIRRQERERAAVELNTATRNLRSQFKQQLDDCLQQHKREINQLQEKKQKSRALAKTLRSTLTDTEKELVISKIRVHELETQVSKEKQLSASKDRRVNELESNIRRVRKELETQKEEARKTYDSAVRQLQTQAELHKKSQGESRHQIEAELDRVRRQEQGKSTAELNNALAKLESKFQQELKKQSDNNSKREREQQEVITKLQQQEKKLTSLVESLRSNLDETQQQLAVFGKRVAELETQVLEEQQVSADRKRRAEELEDVSQRLSQEVESKKAAREEAMAKISGLEVVISGMTRDVDFERQRLKGARERIILLETQLGGFCATTEEIKQLFSKQQEKMEALHKALEEKEINAA